MRYRDIVEAAKVTSPQKAVAANEKLRRAASDRAQAQRNYADEMDEIGSASSPDPSARAAAITTLQKRQKSAAKHEQAARAALSKLSKR